MNEIANMLENIEQDLRSRFNQASIENDLRAVGVSNNFLSQMQSFGVYREVDLLDYLPPATLARWGSVNATATLLFDKKHRRLQFLLYA